MNDIERLAALEQLAERQGLKWVTDAELAELDRQGRLACYILVDGFFFDSSPEASGVE